MSGGGGVPEVARCAASGEAGAARAAMARVDALAVAVRLCVAVEPGDPRLVLASVAAPVLMRSAVKPSDPKDSCCVHDGLLTSGESVSDADDESPAWGEPPGSCDGPMLPGGEFEGPMLPLGE